MTNQEMNEAVALKLGWSLIHHDDSTPAPYTTIFRKETGILETLLPDYCHSIEAAWEIMENVKGYKDLIHQSDGHWVCYFSEVDGDYSIALTAPRAICLEFLKLR